MTAVEYLGARSPGAGQRAGDTRPNALRVLYHHRTQGRGAESIHIASIVRALGELGHAVEVLGPPGTDVLATEGTPPVDKSAVGTRGLGSVWKWISRHLPGALFEMLEIGYNVPAWWRLRGALRTQRFDLVYERYAFYLVAGIFAARRYGVPVVLEANEINGIDERARPQYFPRLCARFERWLMARATVVLTVSSHLADGVREVADATVIVVPNAVHPEALAGGRHRPELVKELGLEGNLVLGFAGWFDDWDRLDTLVDALRDVRERYPNTKALILGDGPQSEGLRAQIARYALEDAVLLTGPIPRHEMFDYMNLIDIAVLPHATLFQSPMVMFEFMACQCPIVAPKVPGALDVLIDGETALLFDRGDISGLTARIERLLGDGQLRASLAAAAHRDLSAKHLWTHNAQAILDAAGVSTP